MGLLQIAARVASGRTSRIRHKHGRFDMARFRAMETPEEMQEYADNSLELVGRGSSRAVYSLTGSKVLKVAAPRGGKGSCDAGVAQNQAEADLYTDPATRDVTTRIFDFDPEYRWLVSEAVRPVSEAEFEASFGSPLSDVMRAVTLADSADMTVREALEALEEDGEDVPDGRAVDMVLSLVRQGLLPGDLEEVDHWGKTTSGRVVLLDYGFTSEVSRDHYRGFDKYGEDAEPDGGGLEEEEAWGV